MSARRLTAEQQLRRDSLIFGREVAYGRSKRRRQLIAAMVARRGWRR